MFFFFFLPPITFSSPASFFIIIIIIYTFSQAKMEMSTKCDWLSLKMAIITIKPHMSAAAFVPAVFLS